MTTIEFKEKMIEIAKRNDLDEEATHAEADYLMCDILTDLGYGEGVNIFYEMTRWYA